MNPVKTIWRVKLFGCLTILTVVKIVKRKPKLAVIVVRIGEAVPRGTLQ